MGKVPLRTVTVKLTTGELEALDQVTNLKYEHNRSRAIVAALHLLFAHHKMKAKPARELLRQRRYRRVYRGAHAALGEHDCGVF